MFQLHLAFYKGEKANCALSMSITGIPNDGHKSSRRLATDVAIDGRNEYKRSTQSSPQQESRKSTERPVENRSSSGQRPIKPPAPVATGLYEPISGNHRSRHGLLEAVLDPSRNQMKPLTPWYSDSILDEMMAETQVDLLSLEREMDDDDLADIMAEATTQYDFYVNHSVSWSVIAKPSYHDRSKSKAVATHSQRPHLRSQPDTPETQHRKGQPGLRITQIEKHPAEGLARRTPLVEKSNITRSQIKTIAPPRTRSTSFDAGSCPFEALKDVQRARQFGTSDRRELVWYLKGKYPDSGVIQRMNKKDVDKMMAHWSNHYRPISDVSKEDGALGDFCTEFLHFAFLGRKNAASDEESIGAEIP